MGTWGVSIGTRVLGMVTESRLVDSAPTFSQSLSPSTIAFLIHSEQRLRSAMQQLRRTICLATVCCGLLPVHAVLAQDPASESEKLLRVLTYNIHHGEGTDGKFDYDRLEKTITELRPDIIAVQEVDVGTQRAGGVDQATELGKRLKMHHAFGNALYFSGGEYGEAILSRFPIQSPKAHHLPFQFGNEPRTALEARIIPDNGLPEFIFVGTHLCHESDDNRRQQTKLLNQLFHHSELPVILAGDMNARPTSDPMKILFDSGWVDTVAPNSRIDYVLVRKQDPWQVIETQIIDEPIVSDHDPVLTILKWNGEN